MRATPLWVLVSTLVLAAGCDCSDEECESANDCGDRLGCIDNACAPCTEDAHCGDEAVCDLGLDGEPGCYDPVVIRGQVFDLADGEPIAGARVVAIDANGAPASSVAIT